MMKRFKLLAVGALLAVGLAAPSHSATLNLTGSLSLTIGALPAVVVPSVGNTAIFVSSGTGDFVEPSGVFGPVMVPLPKSLFTGVPQISGLTLTSFGNGTKIVTGGVGVGGLAGSALVTVLQSLNLTIPLSVVGVAGATVQAGAGSIIITVIGQNWTTGMAAVTGITSTTPGTNVVNTAIITGSDNRTASHAGTITLVSGFQAITNVAGTLPGFAIQALTFVPEAGTLLLLGSGVIGLAMYGRRRMRN